MRMWRVGQAMLAGGCLLATVCVPPAQAQELKIGFVNLGKVFDSYEKTKMSDAALEKQGKQKEAELQAKLDELKKLRESLELLNDESRESKQRQIDEKAEELQRFKTSAARDLRRDRDKIAKEILATIEQTVEQYAKTNNFSLIVDERSLLYGQPAYDATDEIVKLLNSHPAAQ